MGSPRLGFGLCSSSLNAMKAILCFVALAIALAAPEASAEAEAAPFFFGLFSKCDCRNYYTKSCKAEKKQECQTTYKDECHQVYVEKMCSRIQAKCVTVYKDVCV